MAAPRKVFRIEQTSGVRRSAPADEIPAPAQGEIILQELTALRALLQAPGAAAIHSNVASDGDVQGLVAELRLIQSAIRIAPHENSPPAAAKARIAGELTAATQDSERATQKILAAAEDIDQAANNLSATLKGDFELGLAQDIRERVIQIFEACNFQDLISQRIAKVTASFDGLAHQIARATAALSQLGGAPPLHGPRLHGDLGHVSQHDVDCMFDGADHSAE
jgi:chemotaxis protein CheZ